MCSHSPWLSVPLPMMKAKSVQRLGVWPWWIKCKVFVGDARVLMVDPAKYMFSPVRLQSTPTPSMILMTSPTWVNSFYNKTSCKSECYSKCYVCCTAKMRVHSITNRVCSIWTNSTSNTILLLCKIYSNSTNEFLSGLHHKRPQYHAGVIANHLLNISSGS